MPYGQYYNNDDNNNFQELHAIYIQEQHIKSQQDRLRVPVLPLIPPPLLRFHWATLTQQPLKKSKRTPIESNKKAFGKKEVLPSGTIHFSTFGTNLPQGRFFFLFHVLVMLLGPQAVIYCHRNIYIISLCHTSTVYASYRQIQS